MTKIYDLIQPKLFELEQGRPEGFSRVCWLIRAGYFDAIRVLGDPTEVQLHEGFKEEYDTAFAREALCLMCTQLMLRIRTEKDQGIIASAEQLHQARQAFPAGVEAILLALEEDLTAAVMDVRLGQGVASHLRADSYRKLLEGSQCIRELLSLFKQDELTLVGAGAGYLWAGKPTSALLQTLADLKKLLSALFFTARR